MEQSREKTDRAMMARCVELSAMAARLGEYPFGAVVALDGRIIAEGINHTLRDKDVSRHAEVIALALALKSVGRSDLARATLYCNVEPCAMCSYCIREAWVGRVVYGLASPVMGGTSKWNILRDADLSSRIPIFGPAPEVVSGVLHGEVQQAWRSWNPVAWKLAQLRGVLAADEIEERPVEAHAAHRRSVWHYAVLAFLALSKRAKPIPVPVSRRPGTEP